MYVPLRYFIQNIPQIVYKARSTHVPLPSFSRKGTPEASVKKPHNCTSVNKGDCASKKRFINYEILIIDIP